MEIEDTLMNANRAPDIPLDISLMDKQYGDASGVKHSPLEGMTVLNLKEELVYLCQQWRIAKGNKEPECFQDILHMVNASLKKVTPLDHWEINAKYVLILFRLIVVAAGTSAFAERTFSLARIIKTWLRSHMDDSTFADLGLLAWYKDNLDGFIDPVQIGNKYIGLKPGRKTMYGTSFTEKDFNNN